jgi:hypothetical protein
MRDMETEVKELLRSMANEAGDPGDLPNEVSRRAALRRLLLGGSAGLLLLGLVFGGLSLAGDGPDRDGDRTPVVSESHPAPPESMKGELVATGMDEGYTWWLTAYRDAEDDLCTEFLAEDDNGRRESSEGCGGVSSDKHPIGLSESYGGGFSSAIGDVPQDTVRLELALEGDGSRSIEPLYDAPDDLGFPVRFFVILDYPRQAAEEFVAYDGSGNEIGSLEIFDEPVIERIAGPFLLDEGEYHGVPYTFRASVSRQVLPDGGAWEYPCVTFMLGEAERYGGGGSCQIPLARGHDVNFSQNSFEDRPDIVPAFGATSPRVDRVTIELDSGEGFEAQMFDSDETEFRFFLAFPQPDDKGRISGQVVAYRGAEVLERVDLCADELLDNGGGGNSSCGP